MTDKTIAFIGTGNMSYAIIGGMIKQGFDATKIIATNRNAEKLAKVAADFGVQTSSNNIEAIERADVVVLSVKPQMMAELCQTIQASGIAYQDKLFVSVAAGITINRLQTMLGHPVRLIRCMPNTPSLVGKGVSGLFTDSVSVQEKDFVEQVFQATGLVVWLDDESKINDIIAVTGSSPAYFFLFMESIEAKAIELGFTPEQARQLVEQTALGSAMMACNQGNISLAQLRANVTSKGGTTHAAIETFKANHITTITSDAMDACIARAKEMEQEL